MTPRVQRRVKLSSRSSTARYSAAKFETEHERSMHYGVLCDEGCQPCDLIDSVMPAAIKSDYPAWYASTRTSYRVAIMGAGLAFAQALLPQPATVWTRECERCGGVSLPTRGTSGRFCVDCLAVLEGRESE